MGCTDEQYKGMSECRWLELSQDTAQRLTIQEINNGWHFCDSWDGLLMHLNDPEYESCHCGYKGEIL